MFKLCPSGGDLLYADPKADSHKLVTGLPNWQGTVVGVDIAVENGRNFSALIDYIRKSYTIGVKRSKKAYYKSINFQ